MGLYVTCVGMAQICQPPSLLIFARVVIEYGPAGPYTSSESSGHMLVVASPVAT